MIIDLYVTEPPRFFDDLTIGVRFRLDPDGDVYLALGHPERRYGQRFEVPVAGSVGTVGVVAGYPSDPVFPP